MDRSDVITLVSETREQDAHGIWRSATRRKKIFCQVNSVTRAEFFEGGRNGLNPEYVFTVFFGDYSDEEMLIYNGKTYSIYRTYRGRGDELELYAERKGVTNGKGNA